MAARMVARLVSAFTLVVAGSAVAGCAASHGATGPDPGRAVRTTSGGASPSDERVARSVASAAAGNEVVCAYEAPLGSLVRRHVCRTRLESQRDGERTRTWVEDLRRRH